ncbi:hypothetical protein [Micromonospora sp. NPDC126480]|uniref:hypothetical protein n=1 Tax=Micromonospora sp. NPDC126480 TaxID=3155312 RepID=UPI003319AF40
MSRRVARLLLAVAARRWPAELRNELRREWAAELHTLAAGRQHVRMLRFAASLAARRSGVEAGDRTPLGRWVSRAVPLLLAPTAGVAVVAVALVLTSIVVHQLSWHVAWAYDLQLPLLTVLVGSGAAGLAVVAHRLAGRLPSAVPTGPETVVDGVPQGDTVDPVSAPLWLLVAWTDSALGLPRPTGAEIFRITDVLVPLPHFYLAVTPYAVVWTIRATRARPTAAPALAVASG